MVMRGEVYVSICVHGFSVHPGGNFLSITCHKDMKER
jgi:hypothetical protein